MTWSPSVVWGEKPPKEALRKLPHLGDSSSAPKMGHGAAPSMPSLPPIPPWSLPINPHKQHLYDHLLAEQRRELSNQRRAYEKAFKQEIKRWKQDQKEKRKEEKEEEKARKKVEKAEAKLLKYQLKHPHQLRGMPLPAPATPAPPPEEGKATGFQSMSYMMYPTMEGVRRPFDAGRPSVGYANGQEWPMMSRTYTHALLDMADDERLHLANAGLVGQYGM